MAEKRIPKTAADGLDWPISTDRMTVVKLEGITLKPGNYLIGPNFVCHDTPDIYTENGTLILDKAKNLLHPENQE